MSLRWNKILKNEPVLKITNESYTLPRVHATEWRELFDSGTTGPMLILGIDQDTGIKDSYILKPSSSPRMYPGAICKEFLGAWTGIELGLNVFEPNVITISPEFAETLKGEEHYSSMIKSIGLNFGTKYLPGCRKIPSNLVLTNSQTERAEQIITFDMFISNADRGAGNDNLLMHETDLYVFDHELAFSYLLELPFLRNPTPWVFQDRELDLLHKHFLYTRLRNTKINISEFIERFTMLGDDFWSRAKNLLPEQWISEDFDTIKNYLTLITENRAIFAKELSNALLV